MKLVMTLLVRDAEDLLDKNIAFHRRQGVDFFIITDNASADATPEIAQRYVDRGLAFLIDEPCDDYSQAAWVTRMARLAATDFGADWVINNDQDEFWYHPERSLKTALARVPEHWDAVHVERANHAVIAGVDQHNFQDLMIYREQASINVMGAPLPGKVCHRARADIDVHMGNHRVARAGTITPATDRTGLRNAHFPVRDFGAFEKKIMLGGAALARNTGLDPAAGQSWRILHELWREGRLRDWYEDRVLDRAQVDRLLASGGLIRDETVATALRATVDEPVH